MEFPFLQVICLRQVILLFPVVTDAVRRLRTFAGRLEGQPRMPQKAREAFFNPSVARLAFPEQQVAQLVKRVAIVGRYFQSLAESSNRIGSPALPEQNQRQTGMYFGKAGAQY